MPNPMWRKILFTILLLIAAGIAAGGFYVWRLANDPVLRSQVVEHIAAEVPVLEHAPPALIPQLLGFDKPKTYLVQLLNNTELRPGGGFIGAYAVVRFTNGKPELLTVNGTEVLDSLAPAEKLPEPPAPIKKYLKVERWYFRDSNWYPDFASSSVWGLDLYGRENGLLASEVDGVIGFTPTVVEDILKILGPITVQGQQFTAENFTEKLEYEVEYGYKQKGLDFRDRKGILAELFHALGNKFGKGTLAHWPQYLAAVQELLTQKQIVVYARDPALQSTIVAQGFGGVLTPASSTADYVLWTDANLGALKTDAALTRSLSYGLVQTGSSTISQASMTYAHRGTFDWRTSRYISYTRAYVPRGSRLLAGYFNGARLATSSIDFAIEAGRQSFGTVITFEPGTTSTLTFVYQLPSEVVSTSHPYRLMVQKQIGTPANQLTLNLDFDRTINTASPLAGFKPGTAHYEAVTDLAFDRTVQLDW